MTDLTALEPIAERWLSSLQIDFKDFLRVVADDPDLDEAQHAAMLCAVLYTLSPNDVLPDSLGAMGYLDDALALRMALADVRAQRPDRFESYRERVPQMAESVDGDGSELALFREALGDAYEPFRARVFSPERNVVKGKRVGDLLEDPDGPRWLSDEVQDAALALDFKPSAVQSAARRVGAALATIQQKVRR